MNQKIDSANPKVSEFTPEFLRWITTTTFGAILLVLIPRWSYAQTLSQFFILPPPVQAAGRTIAIGLSEFSGHTPMLSGIELFNMLATLIVFYIFGPVLWLFSWRVLHQFKAAGTPITKIMNVWSILFIIGGALTLRTGFNEVTNMVMNRIVSAQLYAAQDVQRTKDQLIGDLITISNEAYDYYILPKSLNGGNKSYEGFCIPLSQENNDHGQLMIVDTQPQKIMFLAISSKNNLNTILVSLSSTGQVSEWKFSGEYN
jgi:hypothetical protein